MEGKGDTTKETGIQDKNPGFSLFDYERSPRPSEPQCLLKKRAL